MPVALLVLALLTLLAVAPALADPDRSARSLIPRPYHPYLGLLDPSVAVWFEGAFQRYAKAFVRSDGRVVDPQNGGITHSESQGYGMLLALLGNDRRTFERIWRFARDTLQRPDGLFAWKYEPGRGVTDRNNATDGEILIASALALASMRWQVGSYRLAAERIAEAVGRRLILRYGGRTLLLPGEWARPTRFDNYATVNLSYHIPFATPLFSRLAPSRPWGEVARDERRLFDALIHPPSEWTRVSEHGEPVPAAGFPPEFSWNAVRIPLYLLQAERAHAGVRRVLLATWVGPDEIVPFRFNVYTFQREGAFHESAYDFIHDLMICAETREPVRVTSFDMPMRNYYASSLHLLAIAALYASYPHCYPRTSPHH